MTLIRLRGGTEYEWETADPTLEAREVGVTTDTHRLKVGDGVSAWSSLPWADAVAVAAGLPTGGTTGQLLTKDSGADYDASWATVDLLPSQTSNAGKYLTTDGAAASWGSPVVVSDTEPTAPTLGTVWVDTGTVATVATPWLGMAVVGGDHTVGDADVIVVLTGAGTVTLPSAATTPGRIVTVKAPAAATATVTASDLIDGSASLTLPACNAVTVAATGTTWVIV